MLGTDGSDIQTSWLQALDDANVEVLLSVDEEEERVRSSESIFEFEARTIDGELISLDKYR